MLNFPTLTSRLILKIRRDFRQMFRKDHFIFARGYKKQKILVIKHRDKKKNIFCSPRFLFFISAVSGSWSLGRSDSTNLRSDSTNLRSDSTNLSDRSDSGGSWSCSNSIGTGSVAGPVSKLPGQKKNF